MSALQTLIGEWRTEATHPMLPGVVVQGTSTFEQLGKFIDVRAQSAHPDFPNSVSVIGETAGLRMHYFDDRGVHRLFDVTVAPAGIQFSLVRRGTGTEFATGDPGFWQRFDGRVEDRGNKLVGLWQLSQDNVKWDDDLAITFWRK